MDCSCFSTSEKWLATASGPPPKSIPSRWLNAPTPPAHMSKMASPTTYPAGLVHITELVDMVWKVEEAKPWLDMSGEPLTIFEASTWAWLMVATDPREVETAEGCDAELIAPRSY